MPVLVWGRAPRPARSSAARQRLHRPESRGRPVSQFTRLCHPERSEGSAFCGELHIPHFVRDDNSLKGVAAPRIQTVGGPSQTKINVLNLKAGMPPGGEAQRGM